MSSLRRILSSRANGAHSSGPKTPAGKRRSALNAMRHGLLSDCVVLPGESREAFDELVAQHLERLDPVDGVEFGMIEELAAAYWRLRRAWAIENHLLAEGLAAQPAGDDVARIAASFRQIASTPELALLHRYETRLHLMYQRALHNLLLLRTAGVPNEPNPISGQSGPEVLDDGVPGLAVINDAVINDAAPIDAVPIDVVPIDVVPISHHPGRYSEMRLPEPPPCLSHSCDATAPAPVPAEPEGLAQMTRTTSGNDKSSCPPPTSCRSRLATPLSAASVAQKSLAQKNLAEIKENETSPGQGPREHRTQSAAEIRGQGEECQAPALGPGFRPTATSPARLRRGSEYHQPRRAGPRSKRSAPAARDLRRSSGALRSAAGQNSPANSRL